MKTVGIICEYNPLHLGHRKQIDRIRERFGEDTAIVCAMSGNFVQRGAPAIIDKTARAKAAVACGADLVVELPVTGALSSAEGFAAAGVRTLAPLCDTLCFGAESAEPEALMVTAHPRRHADLLYHYVYAAGSAHRSPCGSTGIGCAVRLRGNRNEYVLPADGTGDSVQGNGSVK